MNFEDMTKEELIAYIKEMETKRAFTYEDQMKLAILDNSPFTVWASDRNCKIKLWMGQCESLYGFSSKEAIGKDYVDLFVAEDEKAAARRDQIEIIDNEAVFHNIANDTGKNGNTLQLITNCRRIRDPVSGEYWNAEMGLIIDYLEQEKNRLKAIVIESQRIKSSVNQFVEDTKQVKDQFLDRKKSINTAIHDCEQKATALRRRTEFRKKVANIRSNLSKLSQEIDAVLDTYISKMQSCATFNDCEKVRQLFFKEYEIFSESLEDMALDLFEISCDYDLEQNLVSEKDALMKDMAFQFRLLAEIFHNIIREVEKEINDYKEQVSANPNSETGLYKDFIETKHAIFKLKEETEMFEDELSIQIINAPSRLDLKTIKEDAETRISFINQHIEELKNIGLVEKYNV